MLRPSLVTVEEARELVLSQVQTLPAESIELADALGRVLAQSAVVPRDVPSFDNSAMDGYAVLASDLGEADSRHPVELEVVGESRAGDPAERPLRSGEAIAISTGAVVPAGADSVVRVEDTQRADGRLAVLSAPAPGLNVRRAGEDLREGEIAIEAGAVIGPAELGVLASLGLASVEVRRLPSLSVLTTGDELRQPGTRLGPGQLYDTNSRSVAALAVQSGARVTAVDHAADRAGAVKAALARTLGGDVAVVCGGISAGEHDYVRAALTELGIRERFWGIALRPGKPTWFGVGEGDRLVFGLPGNPVSAMVTFLLLVRPALLALAGADLARHRASALLDAPYPKKPGRAHAVRCRLRLTDEGWRARPTKEQGSHVLSSMLGADCLALIPAEAEDLQAGSRVEIELLPPAPLRGIMEAG